MDGEHRESRHGELDADGGLPTTWFWVTSRSNSGAQARLVEDQHEYGDGECARSAWEIRISRRRWIVMAGRYTS